MKMNTIMDNTANDFYINSGTKKVRNDGEGSMMMEELEGMIESLEVEIRQPFMMHYLGYKYQEIADELNLPLGTVKSRIFFARKALKGKIKKQYGSEEFIKRGLAV